MWRATIDDMLLFFFPNVSSLNEQYPDFLEGFNLFQHYPNPYNPKTTINYQIPSSGKVTLKIFDLLGQELTTLVDEIKETGTHSIKFSVNNFLSTGVYLYRLQFANLLISK